MSKSFSQAKGARAERAVIDMLQPIVVECYSARGLEAPILQRNTLQSDRGGYDIVGLDWIALEVKHQEKLAVEQWWDQTIRQAKNNTEPVLFYKQNNVKFRVRLWGRMYVHGGNNHQWHVIEISPESFLAYFRERIIIELELRG
jgi:hypothetical protein